MKAVALEKKRQERSWADPYDAAEPDGHSGGKGGGNSAHTDPGTGEQTSMGWNGESGGSAGSPGFEEDDCG